MNIEDEGFEHRESKIMLISSLHVSLCLCVLIFSVYACVLLYVREMGRVKGWLLVVGSFYDGGWSPSELVRFHGL